VDRRHQRVRFGGDNGEAVEIPGDRIVVDVVQPGEGEERLVRRPDEVGPLGFAGNLPFREEGRRDETPLAAERRAEGGLVLDAFGPRFPAMADALDTGLRARAREAAPSADLRLREGVYIMLSGPYYETRAEMRMLRLLGGDAVGMSTVPEVLVARHAGRRVLAFSLITNKATADVEAGATHAEVIEMGRVGGERLVRLLRAMLPDLA